MPSVHTRAAAAGCTLLLAGLPAALGNPAAARAEVLSVAGGYGNQGWDPAEPRLSQAVVAALSTTPRFSAPVDGVVYAQPLIDRGVVVVATEHDKVYGFDAVSGGQLWMHDVGPYEPDSHNCDQVTPHLGITSTPVIDPATNTAYVVRARRPPQERQRGVCMRWMSSRGPSARDGRWS